MEDKNAPAGEADDGAAGFEFDDPELGFSTAVLRKRFQFRERFTEIGGPSSTQGPESETIQQPGLVKMITPRIKSNPQDGTFVATTSAEWIFEGDLKRPLSEE